MKKSHKNIIIILIILLIAGIGAGVGYFLYQQNIEEEKKDFADKIKKTVELKAFDIETCKYAIGIDTSNLRDNKNIIKKDYLGFLKYKSDCDKKFNIKNFKVTLDSCGDIIKKEKEYFEENYINIEKYENIKSECYEKYLLPKVSSGAFFDPENDFKSTVYIDLGVDFFEDIGKSGTEEFLENRKNAKNKLISILDISPKVVITEKNIVLYKRKAILNIKLESLKSYQFKFKTNKDFLATIETPENKYLGIKILDKVSLYIDTKPPRFKLIEYKSGKESVKVKICRISNENYAKIEILRGKGLTEESKEFFKEGIDKLPTYECKTKNLLVDNNNPNFNFDDIIGSPARSGLYFVVFDNYIDREFNNRIQYPLFFGIIDSHITMKISKNGEGFFFVNDFKGNPLSGQEIRVYLNDFKSHERKWDSNKWNENRKRKGDYVLTDFSPFDTDVLSKEIFLGKTDNKGVLKVDLKAKIGDAFERTFSDSYNYDYNGIDKSFFVTSASKTNLSYVHSKWNGGIAPWNFGYTIGGWWGNNDENQISLNRWGSIEPDVYSYIYTDRVLYLPGEKVNFKAILRNSKDLSISKGKSFTLKINDSNGKEIYNKLLELNSFGSIFDELILPKTSPLGNYNISLFNKDDKQVGNSGFSVEVFKNPKFKVELSAEAIGLESGMVKIDKETEKKYTYWTQTNYEGKFSIKSRVTSVYYNGTKVKNAKFKYKVYKQYYYDNSWWDDCYYGCYWEPQKELYTSGEGVLDENGIGNIKADIAFSSNYNDFKYIIEATVTDSAGDNITGANSIIAKMPEKYKRWYSKADLFFNTEKKFYKTGEEFTIKGGLNTGKWSKYYDDKYIFVVKRKVYETKYVNDVKGYERPITSSKEVLEKIIFINTDNFEVGKDGKLSFKYKAEKTGEYIFEWGKINESLVFKGQTVNEIIKELSENNLVLEKEIIENIIPSKWEINRLIRKCIGDKCSEESIYMQLGCKLSDRNFNKYSSEEIYCSKKNKKEIIINQKIKLDNIILNKKYTGIYTYGKELGDTPIISDNKIKVISEKVSYKLGEKARLLIRLPFENGKILLTHEKSGVIKSEYINIEGNTFFKEFTVDDSYMPNSYFGVLAIDTNNEKIPEYKVGYTEIVVDKTDKKVDLKIITDKKIYSPREEVVINIDSGKKSEVSIMVVDDSLISLMGNIDLNILQKFYKKLPFQIQTSITNIAMLKNYYFSRPGIVGGSGLGNFKGGDSAVSSRNIFKNTAYYNPSIITDDSGKAQIKFNLPDNLTNFRIIAISNSTENFFGVSEEFIEVRKNVIIEDKTPIILRDGDKLKVGANVFNNTEKEIEFKVSLTSDYLTIKNKEKILKIGGGKSRFLEWDIESTMNTSEVSYKITALGDSVENSDKIENTISLKVSPVLITNTIKNEIALRGETITTYMDIPENTNYEKSIVEVFLSNNKLNGIEKIISSLIKYPYGCIEQTVSSTYPNAILLKFGNLYSGIIKTEKAKINLQAGIDRIATMQTTTGGFAYWQGGQSPDLHITPYVLRRLVSMKELGGDVPDSMIEKATSYLSTNFKYIKRDVDRAETFLSFASMGKGKDAYNALIKDWDKSNISRHSLIAYTYGLVYFDKRGFKKEIDANIEKIKTLLDKEEKLYRYWSDESDKAIFTSLLIDYNYEPLYVDFLIGELYDKDWSNYYYSTTTKNNAFVAFMKYIEKYGKNKYNLGTISSGNMKKGFELGESQPNFKKMEFPLNELFDNGKIKLDIKNTSGGKVYADIILKHFPKDKLLVKPYSNKMTIKREIFKVIDENKLSKCGNNYYNNGKAIDCSEILELNSSNTFEKGQLYKVRVEVNLDSNKERKNLVIEDFLPSTFRVINDRFKTESSVIKQNTTGGYRWSHKEFLPDRVFANASYFWDSKAVYEYFVIPEFEGSFTYPPTTAYMMYNPIIRANGKFEEIIVK